MKIAISASGPKLDSPFEPRFGRAPGFVIYDTETENIEFLDNSANQGLPQGAGIQTAQKITQAGAEVLITGNIGPKASQALAGSSLKIFNCEAQTVSEAIQLYQKGGTSPSTGQQSSFGKSSGQSAPGTGTGRGIAGGGQGMGGGARGRGPGQGGRGMGGGGRGRGMKGGGRGMGGGQR